MHRLPPGVVFRFKPASSENYADSLYYLPADWTIVPQVERCRRAKVEYLFSTDGGHASSAHEAVSERAGRLGGLDLGADGSLEGGHLVILEDDKERFEQDDGLAQARIQVVMGGVDDLPFGTRPGGTADGQVFHSNAEVAAEVADHFFEGVNFVEESRALGEEHFAEQVAHVRGALLLRAQKIFCTERGGVRDGAVMLGVQSECAQHGAEITRQTRG
jgi:hypothetical protein